VHRELEKLRAKPLGSLQLHTAKVQAIGQMAMSEENYAGLMLVYGKSLLDHGKIDPLDLIFDQIRSTTAAELQDIAQEIFQADQLTQLIYTPA
jgi:predicted Zn-dependent peptidase